jgi:hypothetical protein
VCHRELVSAVVVEKPRCRGLAAVNPEACAKRSRAQAQNECMRISDEAYAPFCLTYA